MNVEADEKSKFSARDSLACKYSASKMKYFQDPYIETIYKHLKNTIGSSGQVRRSPIIHRGYFARNESFIRILDLFLESNSLVSKQILFLGPGFDTSPLYTYSKGFTNVRTFEIDFPEIISKTMEVYNLEPTISSLLKASPSGDSTSKPGSIGQISFIGQDMRDTQLLIDNLIAAGFDGKLPTLVLSECVLIYMEKNHVTRLCNALSSLLQHDSLWMTYDMIKPHDIYGRSMEKNLNAVGFKIPGFRDFPDLAAQQNRFLESGWLDAHSCNMRYYFDQLISAETRLSLNKIEILDEVEEWNMLMEHYSLTIAVKGSTFSDIMHLLPRA